MTMRTRSKTIGSVRGTRSAPASRSGSPSPARVPFARLSSTSLVVPSGGELSGASAADLPAGSSAGDLQDPTAVQLGAAAAALGVTAHPGAMRGLLSDGDDEQDGDSVAYVDADLFQTEEELRQLREGASLAAAVEGSLHLSDGPPPPGSPAAVANAHADALCAREGFVAVSHGARAADVAAAAADLALQREISQQAVAAAATAVSRLQLLERRASDAGEEVELVRASGASHGDGAGGRSEEHGSSWHRRALEVAYARRLFRASPPRAVAGRATSLTPPAPAASPPIPVTPPAQTGAGGEGAASRSSPSASADVASRISRSSRAGNSSAASTHDLPPPDSPRAGYRHMGIAASVAAAAAGAAPSAATPAAAAPTAAAARRRTGFITTHHASPASAAPAPEAAGKRRGGAGSSAPPPASPPRAGAPRAREPPADTRRAGVVIRRHDPPPAVARRGSVVILHHDSGARRASTSSRNPVPSLRGSASRPSSETDPRAAPPRAHQPRENPREPATSRDQYVRRHTSVPALDFAAEETRLHRGGTVASGRPQQPRGRHWSDKLHVPRDTLSGEIGRRTLLDEQLGIRLHDAERACAGSGWTDPELGDAYTQARSDFSDNRRRLWELEDACDRRQGRAHAWGPPRDWEMLRAVQAEPAADRREPPSPGRDGQRERHRRTNKRSRRQHNRSCRESSSSSSWSLDGSGDDRDEWGAPAEREAVHHVRASSSRRQGATSGGRKQNTGSGGGGDRGSPRSGEDERERRHSRASSSRGSEAGGSSRASRLTRVPCSLSPSSRSPSPPPHNPKVASKLMALNVHRMFQQYVRPRLPLPAGNTWTALVTLVGRLRHVVRQGRQACGDFHATAWAPEWTSLAQQFLVSCVAAESGEGPVNKILSIGRDLNDTIRDRKLNGPQRFAELVSQLTRRFTSLKVNSIPIMLAQFSVPIHTPLQDWIVQLKELVEGLSCFGDSCPTDAQIVSTAIEGTVSTRSTHSYRPRVHAVARGRSFETLAHGREFELSSDEEGYQRTSRHLYPVLGKGSDKCASTSNNPSLRFWKYSADSVEGVKAKSQLPRDACYNCGRTDHFLRGCPESFKNECGMFCESFGESSPVSVEERWQAKLRSLERKQQGRGPSLYPGK
ncbi:unnamed protein product [Ectocarpus sp. CCAP 1310/34]|nr:unnamed protein product [Ectocarpus sp. CCAP 1310/34]